MKGTDFEGVFRTTGPEALQIMTDRNLLYHPCASLTDAQLTGTVASLEANLAGTFSGAGPLFTSYATGSFALSTQGGNRVSAGVFGLTYYPSGNVFDSAPSSPSLSAVAGAPRTLWMPGGLTLGASFFQYTQGNLNYISGGCIPDLSANIISNLRFGLTAQWHF